MYYSWCSIDLHRAPVVSAFKLVIIHRQLEWFFDLGSTWIDIFAAVARHCGWGNLMLPKKCSTLVCRSCVCTRPSPTYTSGRLWSPDFLSWLFHTGLYWEKSWMCKTHLVARSFQALQGIKFRHSWWSPSFTWHGSQLAQISTADCHDEKRSWVCKRSSNNQTDGFEGTWGVQQKMLFLCLHIWGDASLPPRHSKI